MDDPNSNPYADLFKFAADQVVLNMAVMHHGVERPIYTRMLAKAIYTRFKKHVDFWVEDAIAKKAKAAGIDKHGWAVNYAEEDAGMLHDFYMAQTAWTREEQPIKVRQWLRANAPLHGELSDAIDDIATRVYSFYMFK